MNNSPHHTLLNYRSGPISPMTNANTVKLKTMYIGGYIDDVLYILGNPLPLHRKSHIPLQPSEDESHYKIRYLECRRLPVATQAGYPARWKLS